MVPELHRRNTPSIERYGCSLQPLMDGSCDARSITTLDVEFG